MKTLKGMEALEWAKENDIFLHADDTAVKRAKEKELGRELDEDELDEVLDKSWGVFPYGEEYARDWISRYGEDVLSVALDSESSADDEMEVLKAFVEFILLEGYSACTVGILASDLCVFDGDYARVYLTCLRLADKGKLIKHDFTENPYNGEPKHASQYMGKFWFSLKRPVAETLKDAAMRMPKLIIPKALELLEKKAEWD